MKTVTMLFIGFCCFANGFVYDYAMKSAIMAYKYHIPFRVTAASGCDNMTALAMLSFEQLAEVRAL